MHVVSALFSVAVVALLLLLMPSWPDDEVSVDVFVLVCIVVAFVPVVRGQYRHVVQDVAKAMRRLDQSPERTVPWVYDDDDDDDDSSDCSKS